MIAKSYIERNLAQIERLYNKSASVQNCLFYSKLAILELCGWIEISMDDVIRRHAKRTLKDQNNRKYIENDVIKRTYGFDYNTHFRRMLIFLIGLAGVERLEKKADPALFQPMIAALNSLKTYRDQEAHEYIRGTTRRLDAPSITKSKLIFIYEGLKNLDKILRAIK